MKLGYARTSTTEQEAGLEAQERELASIGIDKLFTEKVSSVAARPQLEAALDYLRDGDTFIVTKLDRLARSVADLCNIVKKIEAKQASLRILAMNLDTTTASGRLMLNVIGSVAQFEREIMLERQREGIREGPARRKVQRPSADGARQGRRGHPARSNRHPEDLDRRTARYRHCQRMANPTGHQGGLEPTARPAPFSVAHPQPDTSGKKRMLAYALRRFACDASIR